METKKNIMETLGEAKKKPRQRSPNYPSISLGKAIARVRDLYDSAKTHSVSVGVAQEKWGFKRLSSAADQEVAALKAYGLLEVTGAGNNREVQVTDLARRIILNSPDATNLIKKAALSPPLHAELWGKYGHVGLPTDDIIRDYLVFERAFNEMFVVSFIAKFRETLSFAKIDEGDNIASAEDDVVNENDGLGDQLMQHQTSPRPGIEKPPSMPTASYEINDIPIMLADNRKGTLRLPSNLTAMDIKLLETQVKNSIEIFKWILDPQNLSEDKK
jgi:hypothetical protein